MGDKTDKPAPQEIVLITRAEPQPKEPPTPWDKAERVSKVLSIAAIPFILAVVGWVVQNRLAQNNLSRDYVQLAVSVLTEKDASKVEPAIREWAVDLLAQHSPTNFSPELVQKLKAGEISFSPAIARMLDASTSMGGSFAVSLDNRWLAATDDDGAIRLFDLTAENPEQSPIIFAGHETFISCVAFSPNSQILATGSFDGTVRLWDLASNDPSQIVMVMQHDDRVVGVAFSADNLFTQTQDEKLQQWDLNTGQLLKSFRLPNPK